MWVHKENNFVIEYIGEIETILENIWTCLQGGQSGLSDRKNEVGKWKEKQQNYLLLLIKHFKLYHSVLCKHMYTCTQYLYNHSVLKPVCYE